MSSSGTFPCDRCDRFFSEKKHLARHIKNIHPSNNCDPIEIAEHPNDDLLYAEQISTDYTNSIETSNNIFNSNSLFKDNRYINFVLKYISKPEVPRSIIIEMVKDLSEILKDIVDDDTVKNILNSLPVTEHQIESILKSLNIFVECRTFCFHKTSEPCFGFNNVPEIRVIEHTIKLYPLVDLFSTIFKETNMFDIMAEYYKNIVEKSRNGKIESMCQSKFFKNILKRVKEKYNDGDDILILPFCSYIDEFEPNNPLGSRSNYKKVAGIYAKIQCIPLTHQSKMYNIFRLGFFHGDDRKKFGNRRVLTPLKDSLNALCDSLLKVNHREYSNVRLVPCILMGDNLSLNQHFDGSEGFNTERACRLCFLSRNDFEYFFSCPIHSLYNKESYEEKLGSQNCCFSQPTIFNEVYFIHAANNPIADPLHDLTEGVCKYDLILILYILIKKKKYFTLEYLNSRILSSHFDSSNSPPLIDSDFEKRGIRMSSAELRSFIKMLPILVGNKIPRDSEEWYLFILMRHILSISFSYFIYEEETVSLLKSIIPIHNKIYWKLYKEYFQKQDKLYLPFKFHMITHYPYIIEQIGPLGHIQNMKFEQGHQLPKRTTASSKCKINILETMAKKVTYQNSHIILNFREYADVKTEIGSKLFFTVEHKNNIRKEFNFNSLNDFSCHTQILFNKKIIKPGMVIKTDGNGKACIFSLIKHIIKYNSTIYLALQSLETIRFDEFLFSFHVTAKNEFNLVLLEESDLSYVTCMYELESKQLLTFHDYFYYKNEI